MTIDQDLLQARYGTGAPLLEGLNDTLRQLLAHRSVRAYTQETVGDDQLTALVAAAQSAASSSNLHAWSVVAVRDPARKAALAELAGDQAHIRQAPLFLVWLADLARLERVAGQAGRPCTGLDFLEMFLVGAVDAALAAQNAVVAAESMGLATVFIGAMRNRPEEVARLLELPPRVTAVFGLCVGYADPALPAAVKPRPPQAVVLHRETYSQQAQDAGVAAYDQTMADFYASQGMKVHGSWSVHSAKRVSGPESLSGRDRLVEALHALGFALR